MVKHWIIWRVLTSSETEITPFPHFSKHFIVTLIPAITVCKGHMMLQNCSLSLFLTLLINMIQIIY